MTADLLIGAVIGFVLAGVSSAVAGWWLRRRLERRQRGALRDLVTVVGELRGELADDKETNRRLRHELATSSPSQLLERVAAAELARNEAIGERDQILEQLELAERDLAAARSRLTKQESKLRRYREALHEIRLSLEAQGRGRTRTGASLLDTGEIVHEVTSLAASEAGRAEPPAMAAPARAADPADVSAAD